MGDVGEDGREGGIIWINGDASLTGAFGDCGSLSGQVRGEWQSACAVWLRAGAAMCLLGK